VTRDIVLLAFGRIAQHSIRLSDLSKSIRGIRRWIAVRM
jgi:hypothetical protein